MKRRGVACFRLMAGFLVLSLFVVEAIADEVSITFDIPASEANEGLALFAEQSATPLIYLNDGVRGKRTNRVEGDYTRMEALNILLKNTGISGSLNDKGVLTIAVVAPVDNRESEMKSDLYKNESNLSLFAGIAAFVASVVSGPNTMAQENDSSDDKGAMVIEEIMVTANKRGAQNIQDIAASVSAVGSETLSRVGAQGFDDYIKLITGLTAVNSGAGQTQIILRGINSGRVNHNQPQARSTVGLYIDESPISNVGFNPDANLFDIERVEVLRGPQGTLYGASSMAGAVRLITRQPDPDKVEGRLEVGISTTDSGGENFPVRGMFNIPLSEGELALRGSFNYVDNGGFIDDVESGEKDYNDEQSWGGKISALWDPDNGFSALFSVLHQDLDTGGRPDEFLPNPTDPRVAGITGKHRTRKFVADVFESEFTNYNLTLSLDVPWGTFTSSTTYADTSLLNVLDDSFRVQRFFGPGLVTPMMNSVEMDDFSQEVRFATLAGETLEVVLGLYYQDQDKNHSITSPIQPPVPPFLTGLTTRFGATNDIFVSDQQIDLEQIAVFGEVTWNVTEQLALTAGARWFDYEVDATIDQTGLANRGPSFVDQTFKEDDVNPKFSAGYQLTDDVLLYGSASKGFRIGGVNRFIPIIPCGADLAALGLSGAPVGVASDTLWNYEGGIRSTWLDGRLVLNGAYYHIDWSDIQSVRRLACGFQFTDNAGDLDVDGVEIESVFSVNEELALSMGLNYNDSVLAAPSENFSADKGDRAPFVPKWNVTGSIDYARSFRGGTTGFARADFRHISNSFSEFSAAGLLPLTELPSYTTIDLTAGVQFDRWTISLFVKNVADDRVVTNVDPERAQPSQFSIARPRTFGARVSADF